MLHLCVPGEIALGVHIYVQTCFRSPPHVHQILLASDQLLKQWPPEGFPTAQGRFDGVSSPPHPPQLPVHLTPCDRRRSQQCNSASGSPAGRPSQMSPDRAISSPHGGCIQSPAVCGFYPLDCCVVIYFMSF